MNTSGRHDSGHSASGEPQQIPERAHAARSGAVSDGGTGHRAYLYLRHYLRGLAHGPGCQYTAGNRHRQPGIHTHVHCGSNVNIVFTEPINSTHHAGEAELHK